MAKTGPKGKHVADTIDPKQVESLAAINCSYDEMASVLDCDPSTLSRNFAQAIQKGRAKGRMSLKRKQYDVAMNGNVSMLIWLGKQLLEQSDKQETKMLAQVATTTETPEQQLERIKSMIKDEA